jgi:hypothetical protein
MLIHDLYTNKYDTLFINGAIGDFIQFDSLLNNEIRNNFKKIIVWNPCHPINNKGELVKKIIQNNKFYPNNVQIETYIENKYGNSAFNPIKRIPFKSDKNFTLQMFEDFCSKNEINKNTSLIQQMLCFETQYTNNSNIICEESFANKAKSSYLLQKLTSLEKFNLPERYCVVVPHTCPGREFDRNDYLELLKILKEIFFMKGVMVGGQKINFHDNNIINLTSQTSIDESIEITKNSCAYIGIDSFLSIFASQILKENKICIKSLHSTFKELNFFYFHKRNLTNFVYRNLNFQKMLDKNKYKKLFI